MKSLNEIVTFDDFKQFAQDDNLTDNERLGFPEVYRQGKADDIYSDIKSKLTNINHPVKKILDIGCGCGDLAQKLIKDSTDKNHELIMVDSHEMLDRLYRYQPKGWHGFPHRFPQNIDFIKQYQAYFDVILIYSVIQHEFNSGDLWGFFDNACGLLADGGQLLIGDIPNLSMRRRFFSSENGIKFHQNYVGRQEMPEIPPMQINRGKIDDSVIFSMVIRARGQGLHGYIMPQNPSLPFANRREDILIVKP